VIVTLLIHCKFLPDCFLIYHLPVIIELDLYIYIYISPYFVLLKMFSLFFILIVSYESVIAFLFWSFLLLYAVPCSRATSLKYEL